MNVPSAKQEAIIVTFPRIVLPFNSYPTSWLGVCINTLFMCLWHKCLIY